MQRRGLERWEWNQWEAFNHPDYVLAQAAAQPAFYSYEDATPGFANPDAPGYGGGPWPFDRERAIFSDGYRRGVFNAMVARWTAQQWKRAAQELLDDVWRWRRIAARWHKDVGKRRGYTYEQSLHVVMGRIPPE